MFCVLFLAGQRSQLSYANLSIISLEECRVTYGTQVADNMVCAVGNQPADSCTVRFFFYYKLVKCIFQGDNGSPLIFPVAKAYAFIGTASFISGNGCESLDPLGYTRTDPYWKWIVQIATA